MKVERIDRRRRGPSRRVRVALIVAGVVLFLLLISLRGLARFYTDFLWFDSLGLSSVWEGLVSARVVPAVVFTAVFFVVLLVNLVVADRVAPQFVPMGPEEEFVQRYRELIGPHAGRIRVGVALIFALIAGGGVSARWHDWLLFSNRVDFGVRDPQFDTDVGFYVFQLPFLKFLFEWTFAALIIVFLVTAVAHYLNGGIRFRSPFEKVTPAVKVHLSILLAMIALVRAWGYWLERFELTFSTRGAVHGASFTDVKAQLPALNMLIVISLVGAALFLVNIRRRGWVLPVLSIGLWAFVSLVIGQIYPAFIQRFRVEPNELTREAPYIARNIAATRAAYGLDRVEVRNFDYSEDLTMEDVDRNRPTVGNIRLWDPDFVDGTYRQLQRIRNFYDFADVDIDRYTVGGRVVQTLVAAREIDLSELSSSTWVNRHLMFTHGYGLVAAQANAVTEDGEPEFLVKDIPPRSTAPELNVERPQLYFAEGMGTYSIVNTKEQEFDYPQAGEATGVTTTYRGRDGVRLSGILRRAAFALRFGDFRFLVSSELAGSSRVLFARDVRERVEKAAPFLRYDADPYPVVVGGRVLWIIDAYTVTDNYPYSQAVVPGELPGASGLRTRLNYVRNSVKVTVDAFDGTVTYYVIDERDPLVRAYRNAFPRLFTDGDEMPDELRAHLRYPADLFRVQTELFASYHVTQPRAFYNRSDQWAVATDPGSGPLPLRPGVTEAPTAQAPPGETRTPLTAGGRQLAETTTGRQLMDPNYLLMRLPGEAEAEFVLLRPFTPPARAELGNLLAFMVAKSDPGEYGRLQAFVMPRGRQVFGPTQVNLQINTTAEISREFTLLGQRGSNVIQGALQVVPIENSLLYVRPLYVQAEAETEFPQLQRVIVFYAGSAVMEPTLEAALAKLFGAPTPVEEAAPPEEARGAPPATAGAEQLDRLARALDEARQTIDQLQARLDEMTRVLRELRGQRETTTTTTPAATPA